mmetsp:Transcript_6880/g.10027  ORF Transcript_6880/g.10027 Transcript_6880/m.10027 type:complete len:245 (+) Transcript_6880:195-929(+)
MGLFAFSRKKNGDSNASTKSTASPAAKKKQSPSKKKKKKVHFTDTKPIDHCYEFDWELEGEYWFSKAELKAFNEVRFDEADVLRKERGIRTRSRNDADEIEEEEDRNIFIGDALTNALDDDNDGHEISLRGIEHFVWPVLQKEMVSRKKQLKKVVIEWRLPVNRRKDPKGLKLAEDAAKLSEWAREVAQERGIKYTEMRRGGMLLKNMRNMKTTRRLSRTVKKGFSFKDMGSSAKNNIYGFTKN